MQRSAPFIDCQMQKGQGVRCRIRFVQAPSISSHSWIHVLPRGLNILLLRLEQQDSGVQSEALCGVCCSSIKHFCYFAYPDPHFPSPAKGLVPFSPYSPCLSALDWPSSVGKVTVFSSPGLSMHPYCSIPLHCTPLVIYLPAIASHNTKSLKNHKIN